MWLAVCSLLLLGRPALGLQHYNNLAQRTNGASHSERELEVENSTPLVASTKHIDVETADDEPIEEKKESVKKN